MIVDDSLANLTSIDNTANNTQTAFQLFQTGKTSFLSELIRAAFWLLPVMVSSY